MLGKKAINRYHLIAFFERSRNVILDISVLFNNVVYNALFLIVVILLVSP